ncbi:MAG: hypothetical protein WKF84_22315 [Pyrinomonadaceae bacterium]
MIDRLNEDVTPAQMRASEATLRKFGLIDNAFRLRPFTISLLTEQIAGYYDPRAGEFYIADWIDIEGQKLVMSHELTHALQDQYFNLRRFEKWSKGDSDAQLAAQALIEGDATLLMGFYMTQNPRRALNIFKSMLATGVNTKQIDKAPKPLRASLLFPYDQGREWAQALYDQGGWDALSKAYQNLPQSTEQILHIDKYLAREQPEKINLPDIAKLLGANWRRIDADVNGEWGYYLILNQFIGEDDSKRAAAGWSGDRYALYEQKATNRVFLIHVSTWDSDDEALEFVEAYAKRTVARYEIRPQATLSVGTKFSAQTSQGEVHIERQGRRVLIVEARWASERDQGSERATRRFLDLSVILCVILSVSLCGSSRCELTTENHRVEDAEAHREEKKNS